MADLSFDELNLIQAGKATASVFNAAAKGVQNLACAFWQHSPGTVIPDLTNVPLLGAWQSFCSGSQGGVPPAPAPPFYGGQCDVAYYVHCTWDIIDTNTGSVTHRDNTLTANGRLINIDLVNPPNQSVGLDITFFNSFSGMEAHAMDTQGYYPRFQAQNLAIISITRVDGNPDNCGNLPSTYPTSNPPPTPTTIGGDTYNLPPVTINYADGTTNNYAASLTLDGGDGFPALNVGGISIGVSGGGLTFGNTGGSGTGGGTSNQDIPGAIVNLNNNVTNLNNTTNNINKNTAPPPPPGGPGMKPPAPKPTSQKKSDGLVGLVSVQIVVTTPPITAVEQFGTDGASNVYYTGWFAWRQAGNDLQKLQISYLNSIFLAPKGVDGYSFTLTHGAQGHSIENTAQENS